MSSSGWRVKEVTPRQLADRRWVQFPAPAATRELHLPHGSDWPSIRDAGRNPAQARIRRAHSWKGVAMDSASERTQLPVVTTHRPRTRIAGPAQNGTEPRCTAGDGCARRSLRAPAESAVLRRRKTVSRNGVTASTLSAGTGRYAEQVPTACAWRQDCRRSQGPG